MHYFVKITFVIIKSKTNPYQTILLLTTSDSFIASRCVVKLATLNQLSLEFEITFLFVKLRSSPLQTLKY